MSINIIKKVAKSKGITMDDLAKQIGYSYAGLYKALKQSSLKYDARLKLSEILDIPLSDIQDVSLSSEFKEPKEKYYKRDEVIDIYKDQIKVLREVIIQKEAIIEKLLKLLENKK